MGASKVLLVADKGVLNAGLTIAIEEELKKRNSCPMPSSIRSSPTPRDVDCAVGWEFAKKEGADVIIAVGGGKLDGYG